VPARAWEFDSPRGHHLELFDSGDIFFGGQSLLSTSLQLNPVMAFISEEQELPFLKPLSFWLKCHIHLYPHFDRKLFDNLSKSLKVNPSKSFHEMSRGQKMKALFCLQAAKKPEVYLLDEITSVLDTGSRWTLMEFLNEEAKRGCLILMSTNIASEMQGFATKVIFLDDGKIDFECSSKLIGEHFRKIQVPKHQEQIAVSTMAARKISLNGDGTWIFLHPRETTKDIPNISEDQREITISDLQSYFTAGERTE
jgi:ABC-type multidrug transport system ATPase subunit